MRFSFIVGLACAACPLSAQGNRAIFPSDRANAEGEYAQPDFPFSGGVLRTQFLYESFDLAIPDGASIDAVGFRQDGTTTVASTGYLLQLEVRMAPTTKTARQTSGTFASNITTPLTTVFTKKVFSLPTLPKPSTTPSSNFAMVPLDAPHVYDGAQNLLVEYLVYSNSNGSQPFSYPLDQTYGQPLPSTTYGSSCPTSGGKTPALTAAGGLLGSYWTATLANGPGSQQVGFLLSTAQANLPLPGAPGCSLLVDLSAGVVVALSTNSSGGASLNLTVPNNLFLHRKNIYGQIAIVDFFANALGVVTSNGVQATLNSPPRGSIITATGNTAATIGANYQLVVLTSAFDY